MTLRADYQTNKMRGQSGVEAESWIMNHTHKTYVRIMNLCFKNLGIMNLCTSARESWITILWEKLSTKYTHKLVTFDPGKAGYDVSESPVFQNYSPGACPRTPYTIRVIGADSRLVSQVTWCLMFSYKKKKTLYLDETNDDTESGWSRSFWSLNVEETYYTKGD